MNVAIFTDNDFEKVNGVTTVLRSVLERVPSDVRVRIYTCDSTGTDRPDYFSLRRWGIGIPYYPEMKMYAPPFLRFLRQARADAIDLIHLTTPGPVGLVALSVAARLRLPLVGSFHTHLAEYTIRLSGSERLGAMMREYMRWMYGRCEQILAPSESTRRVLIESKVDPAKIRIWERGVSTERFAPARRSTALRRAWGVTDDQPVLVYVGRLSKEKGLSEIPVMQSALARASVSHRVVFVGDGPMRGELQHACPDAIFTGALSHDEVAVAMASSDVFLFPSRTDTAGNVVLEAQASGLPVLVTNEGGPRENIRPGHSGEVCASTGEMTAHAFRLCADHAHRARQSFQAREFALSRNWNLALEPLFRAYREIGGSSPGRVGLPVVRAVS